MKQRIIESINDAYQLENLYRENKQEFTRVIAEISEEQQSELITFWKIRLTPETAEKNKVFVKTDLLVLILLSVVSGLLVKLPQFFSFIYEDGFYARDLSIIVFNGLIAYTFWQNKLFDTKKILFYATTIICLLLYVNLLPYKESDSLNLVFIHTPLLLWCLFGLTYISFDYKNIEKRIEFIRFNGELLVMTGLLLIAGGILTGITIGLFSAIKINIEQFYFKYIVVIGSVASPIVSLYLIRMYPNLTNKIGPVIARVFTPLVLITLGIYLLSLLVTNSKIFEDRELLLIFNIMLLAVMALIIFSVSELDKAQTKNINVLILFSLAVLAIVINAIALTAITGRVINGLTPNRTVVLISNILIVINLIWLAKQLFQAYFRNNNLENVEKTVAKYLPVYFVWTIVVILVLPFVFGLK